MDRPSTTLGRILHRGPITASLAFDGAGGNTLNMTHRHLLQPREDSGLTRATVTRVIGRIHA
jgi:hypothetical protein